MMHFLREGQHENSWDHARRMKECIACGSDASITAESLPTYSYTDFTGQPASDSAPPQLHLLPESQR